MYTFRFIIPPILPIKKKHSYSNVVGKTKSWEFYNRVIKHIFSEKREETFIEVGAFDGIFQSNTLYLERNLNWTGLLIEPDIESFNPLKTNNRNSWIINCCLSQHWYPEKVSLLNLRIDVLTFWLESVDNFINF